MKYHLSANLFNLGSAIVFVFISIMGITSCTSSTHDTDKNNQKEIAEDMSPEEEVEPKNVYNDPARSISKPQYEKNNKTKKEGTVLILTSNDALRFTPNQLEATAGEIVTLTLKHTGNLPAKIMGHNFVLLKKGVDVDVFGEAAITARENDYIPNEGKDVIAHTKMIGGGEFDTINFTAPATGTYTFICSFPKHYTVMKGTFVVK